MNTIVQMISVHLKKLLLILLLIIGAQQVQAESRFTYAHTDLFGSVVALTNQAGAVIARKDYTPYGEASGNDGSNHIGFTGHVEDSLTHLTYMQQRMQDPKTGRFLSMDSKPVDPNDPMTFNRYVYGNNNPYKFVDPDGRDVYAAGVTIAGKTFGAYINTDTQAHGGFTSGEVKTRAAAVAGSKIFNNKIPKVSLFEEHAPDQQSFNHQETATMNGAGPFQFGDTNTGGKIWAQGGNSYPLDVNKPETVDSKVTIYGSGKDKPAAEASKASDSQAHTAPCSGSCGTIDRGQQP